MTAIFNKTARMTARATILRVFLALRPVSSQLPICLKLSTAHPRAAIMRLAYTLRFLIDECS
ncbi:hypothetical protein PCASD_22212 [Puccinia coronata f. sp. avenae]|uniref:Uncharacterized protein n=1 Tax=Puccinia coronata f. sp. avenae TaxID=200324 RepID=A0A2N5T7Q5_9BASI|nr:hypothetical protein PCASD_22212 [Puccinia coronata f. sp. avenae]